jgi:hypothetical protein
MTKARQTENVSTEEAARRAAEAAEACPTRLGPTLLSAVVDESGNLIRGRHAVGASRGDVPVGSYIVNFERDVTCGAYVGSVGLPGSSGIAQDGTVTVVGRAGDPNAVYIAMYDENGNRVDRPFHLVVACPESL